MPEPPTDWMEVLRRLLAGDRLAFLQMNRLVSGYLAQVRAYDFRDEWDDLRQEVLVAVIENARAGRLRDPKALLGYVRVITRNKFIDRLKKHLRHHEKDTLPWDDETARAVARDAPEDAAQLASLRAALRELPDEERRVLDGIYRQGQTYDEVSRATGLPLGTMKRRLRTALATLRRRMANEVE